MGSMRSIYFVIPCKSIRSRITYISNKDASPESCSAEFPLVGRPRRHEFTLEELLSCSRVFGLA
eukprot:7152980-Heterocapsa_arctica.AAC.1